MILPAMLSLDRDVDELSTFAQQITVIVCRLRFVRHDRNNGSEFASTDLPDVKIGNE